MSRVTITSRDNAWYRRFHQALRRHEDEIVVEGPKSIRDLVALGFEPLAVALAPGTVLPADLQLARPPLQFAPRLLDSLSDTVHGQGVVALFPRPAWTLADLSRRHPLLVLVADSVQDPGNLGTLIRLAAAFDADAVLCTPGCADPFGPKALRASAGTAFVLPIVSAAPDEIIAALRAHDIQIYRTTSHGSGGEVESQRPAAVVFGSEGGGVGPSFEPFARPVTISMSPRVESLNVSAAAAIVLSKIFDARQRERFSGIE